MREMSNEELVRRLKEHVSQEARCSAEVIEHLAEFDRRELFKDLAYTSLFAYCTQALGYSEDAASARIYAARAYRKHECILGMLRRRELTLTNVVKLAPHLTAANYADLLARAKGLSRLEIEALVASIAPRPAAQRDLVRLLEAAVPEPPASSATPGSLSPGPAPIAVNPTPEATLVRFAFTGSGDLLKKVRRAKELLRHKFPCGWHLSLSSRE